MTQLDLCPTHRPDGLKFAHAFTLVAIAIFLGQLYQVMLAIAYDTSSPNSILPSEYHLYSELGAILWYLLVVTLSTIHIRHSSLSVRDLLDLDFSRLRVFSKTILKYFGGCGIVVIAFSFLTKETELGLR